jgi:hypothetical protein
MRCRPGRRRSSRLWRGSGARWRPRTRRGRPRPPGGCRRWMGSRRRSSRSASDWCPCGYGRPGELVWRPYQSLEAFAVLVASDLCYPAGPPLRDFPCRRPRPKSPGPGRIFFGQPPHTARERSPEGELTDRAPCPQGETASSGSFGAARRSFSSVRRALRYRLARRSPARAWNRAETPPPVSEPAPIGPDTRECHRSVRLSP